MRNVSFGFNPTRFSGMKQPAIRFSADPKENTEQPSGTTTSTTATDKPEEPKAETPETNDKTKAGQRGSSQWGLGIFS